MTIFKNKNKLLYSVYIFTARKDTDGQYYSIKMYDYTYIHKYIFCTGYYDTYLNIKKDYSVWTLSYKRL